MLDRNETLHNYLNEVLGDEEDEDNNINDDFQAIHPSIASVCGIGAVLLTLGFMKVPRENRAPNSKRDRATVKQKILDMNAKIFKRQYRLDKETFLALLEILKPLLQYTEKGTAMGELSSGSVVDPVIMLAVTLRLLAGGSYLDIAFGYHVGESSVYAIFHKTCQAIDSQLDNIEFPFENEQKLRDLESSFLKYCKGAFPGTVAAGDGIVFRTIKPNIDDVDGNVRAFFTRKGFYGHALQAFVDGDCKFVHLSMKVCASTHDGTAYVLSGISEVIKQGKLVPWAHVVLDEAYKCTQQELSPWKGKSLPADKDTFNYYLSLHRQCVERAFGLLVGRWGIFWRPLRFSPDVNARIITVACKLHNLCVDKFGSSRSSYEVFRRDLQWDRGDKGECDSTVLFTDGTTVRRGSRTDLHKSKRREELTQRLKDMGLARPIHSKLQSEIRRIRNL